MNEAESRIVQLANNCRNPEKFFNALENLLVKPPDDKGEYFFQLGTILYKNSYFILALNSWNRALECFVEKGDAFGERACYANMGLAYDHKGDFRKAVQFHMKSLEKAKEARDKESISKCYINLGIALGCLGDLKRAIRFLKKALRIKEEIGDRDGVAKCYSNLGAVYRSLADFGKAIEYNKKALKIAREVGDKNTESACYGNLGFAFSCQGRFRRAIEYQERSLGIAEEIGDKTSQAACYTNLGLAFNSLGDFRKAVEYHEKSLEISIKTGDKMGEAGCCINLGVAHHNLGELRKGIEYNRKALAIKRNIGDKAGEAKCYANLGVVAADVGDFKRAVKYHKKSLRIVKDIKDKVGESFCYGNLGSTYRILGDFSKAIKYHSQSLRIAREIGDKAGEAKCYVNIGVAYRNLGAIERAIKYYEKSLNIAKTIGDKTAESACYRNLGVAYLNLGDPNKAIKYHKLSLKIDEVTGDIDSLRMDNLNLGRIYSESDPRTAFSYLERSIELSELISGRLLEEEHKVGFYARVSDAYQWMVPICLRLKKETTAFSYVEKSKSRAFLDLLACTDIKPTVAVTTKLNSLLNDEATFLMKLREIQTSHLRLGKIPVKLGEVEKSLQNLDCVYNKIERLDPEYVSMRRGKTASFEDISCLLSKQKRNMVLAEYFVTKDKTFIFVVSSREKELHTIIVPLSAQKISFCLENYWREVVQYPSYGDVGDTWLALGNDIIQPLQEFLVEDDVIYFAPHGLLHYFPLHVLRIQGEPLIRRHPVVYSPSASLMRFLQNKGSGKLQSCVSFGVAFEEESSKVAELFNSEPYNGYLATKEKVLQNSVGKDVIHFSCHGYFDELNPLSSGVELYNGEILSAREIFGMKLKSELAVLSACQTGLNQKSPGDELIGLSRAFIYAGVSSVIVSLWSVNALSAKELMLEFYSLLKSGKDKATALQQAQKKMMEKKKYSHPYFWSPFVLVGKWK
jgi:CHAT domain-containing protein/Tfp pilus assembly protein PilF